MRDEEPGNANHHKAWSTVNGEHVTSWQSSSRQHRGQLEFVALLDHLIRVLKKEQQIVKLPIVGGKLTQQQQLFILGHDSLPVLWDEVSHEVVQLPTEVVDRLDGRQKMRRSVHVWSPESRLLRVDHHCRQTLKEGKWKKQKRIYINLRKTVNTAKQNTNYQNTVYAKTQQILAQQPNTLGQKSKYTHKLHIIFITVWLTSSTLKQKGISNCRSNSEKRSCAKKVKNSY